MRAEQLPESLDETRGLFLDEKPSINATAVEEKTEQPSAPVADDGPLSSMWNAFGSRALSDLQTMWSVTEASEAEAPASSSFPADELDEVVMVSTPSIDWNKFGTRFSDPMTKPISFETFSGKVFAPGVLEHVLEEDDRDVDVGLRVLHRDPAGEEEVHTSDNWEALRMLREECTAMEAEFSSVPSLFALSAHEGPLLAGSERDPLREQVSCCTKIWGGPSNPHEEDSMGSWFANFAGGITTAHGINRTCDDHAGPLRTTFWILIFMSSTFALWWLVEGILASFLNAEVAISFVTEASSKYPMITVCNSSPYNCRCEGIYDPAVVENHVEKVLPYVCLSVLVWKDSPIGWMRNPSARLVDDVDIQKTKINMAAFTDTVKCDNGELTKQRFVEKIQSASLSHLDMLQYLGYTRREDLVRFCQVALTLAICF